MNCIDLHIHTTASDGTDSPRAAVEKAASLGLAAVSITDHDSVSGVPEAMRAGAELGVEVVSEADLGVKIEVEETGETFAENSLLKAKAVMEATKLPAIADDSGLCVDALNGGPGVYSARFGGEGLDDTGRYRLLLQMLHGQADRRAHFHTTITCAFPNGDVLQDDGEVEGTIAFAPMGENGFGYDPVFFVPDKRKTFAQLTAEEKAEISHRGKALRAFKETLRNYLAEHQ